MSSSHLIPRHRLAKLNQLRDQPAWFQLSGHLLLIVVAGVLWRQEAFPWLLRIACLLLSGVALATCFAGLHECCHRTAFRSKSTNDRVA
ncbi:MAG: hypothetical protein RLZZ247_333, partial [Cyanobacteriota bacterium]